MNDKPEKPSRQHLPVLGGGDKVEQFKRELAADRAEIEKKLNEKTLIDRAIDTSKSPQQKAVEEKVIELLRTIYDPELPVNIYDLGLIYAIQVADDNSVHLKMTLTAPACPVAETLPPEVERKIETIDEVPRAKVEVVWDPPWSKDRMSEAALLELGLL